MTTTLTALNRHRERGEEIRVMQGFGGISRNERKAAREPIGTRTKKDVRWERTDGRLVIRKREKRIPNTKAWLRALFIRHW